MTSTAVLVKVFRVFFFVTMIDVVFPLIFSFNVALSPALDIAHDGIGFKYCQTDDLICVWEGTVSSLIPTMHSFMEEVTVYTAPITSNAQIGF